MEKNTKLEKIIIREQQCNLKFPVKELPCFINTCICILIYVLVLIVLMDGYDK